MATFHKINIHEVIRETADAVSLVFKIPGNLKSKFAFHAGQYLTLKKTINGKEVRRAYSICSSPSDSYLKVAIKAVENGTFSTYATTELKEGNFIEISEPEGLFTLETKPNKNYIAFAAGSGITPILSMVKDVLENEVSSTFTLIYGNKTVADTIFKEELDVLKEANPDRFNLHYICSREQLEGSLFGRIDKAHTNFYINNSYKNTSFDAAFLCGPESMIDEVSATLTERGFAKENIHFELFTTSIDEEAVAEIKEGTTEVIVMLDDEETTFTMNQTDDLLSASLRNNLDAPYSCQGGVCSTCMCKVTEGNAIMVKNSILTDSEIEEGLVLACQAYPTTSKISIDFDDV
ncbi:ferredoxin--NADP reductase [Polaribacter sp. AHE13PA]|uniref:ferredoxin--NADP reductase n=1 Tax=Polaribacter sp. AHE13PA TaxID=2745562 RepID=UPI001C4F35C4|nr:ferredoxin--NADP reductase [Polaribacter sp. AHE13PA]QXP65999.1 ferredoxin--NADP reductase [Polaribacter sp. AHE13PA]